MPSRRSRSRRGRSRVPIRYSIVNVYLDSPEAPNSARRRSNLSHHLLHLQRLSASSCDRPARRSHVARICQPPRGAASADRSSKSQRRVRAARATCSLCREAAWDQPSVRPQVTDPPSPHRSSEGTTPLRGSGELEATLAARPERPAAGRRQAGRQAGRRAILLTHPGHLGASPMAAGRGASSPHAQNGTSASETHIPFGWPAHTSQDAHECGINQLAGGVPDAGGSARRSASRSSRPSRTSAGTRHTSRASPIEDPSRRASAFSMRACPLRSE